MEIIVFEKEAYYKMLGEIKKTISEGFREVYRAKPNAAAERNEKEWVKIERAAHVLKCGRDKLKSLWKNDEIVAARDGRHILYFEPSLYEYLERKQKQTNNDN